MGASWFLVVGFRVCRISGLLHEAIVFSVLGYHVQGLWGWTFSMYPRNPVDHSEQGNNVELILDSSREKENTMVVEWT